MARQRAMATSRISQFDLIDEPPPMVMYRQPSRSRFHRLPLVLRPRLTPRYLLSSLAVLYVLYCFVRGMPWFSSNLPAYTGPYSVGTIDIESPCDGRLTSDLKFAATGEPAFQVSSGLNSKIHGYWLMIRVGRDSVVQSILSRSQGSEISQGQASMGAQTYCCYIRGLCEICSH